MTNSEMSTLFSLMALAWPNAPMLHNGNMGPTIRLWTICLPDVDFLTGQMAMIELCRTCHFPPSIAQMREAAEKVTKDIYKKIYADYYILQFQAEQEGKPFDWDEIEDSRRRKLLEEMTLTAESLRKALPPRG